MEVLVLVYNALMVNRTAPLMLLVALKMWEGTAALLSTAILKNSVVPLMLSSLTLLLLVLNLITQHLFSTKASINQAKLTVKILRCTFVAVAVAQALQIPTMFLLAWGSWVCSLVASLLHVGWAVLVAGSFLEARLRVERSLGQMLAFHDFLVAYKQTPRSKILKRHLPKLDAVVEEDSRLECSYISTSNEQKQSLIHKSSQGSLPVIERSFSSQIFVFSNKSNEQYFLSGSA